MTEATEPTVRFPHISSPSHLLARPLPEALLATLPAKVRREHEQLVGRVEEAGREFARLRALLDGATARDREAASKAALDGQELPEPEEPKLRAQLEEAQRVRAALDAALRTSADSLLAAAAANAEKVAAELEQQLGSRAEDVRARLADVHEAVAELAEAYAAAGWVRALAEPDERETMTPYQAGRSPVFAATRGELRTAERALDHDLGAAEERRRLAHAQREEERRREAQWSRERAQAASEGTGGR